MGEAIRHVLGLSGGKDSAALAIYMRHRVPEMEYYFCDTQKELPETYQYLEHLEAYLGKQITRLNAERGFDHGRNVDNGYLPSTRMRWCTKNLKIKPFEAFVGGSPTRSYIAIRADEDRVGYISTKATITPVYPFKEDGITEADVYKILEESGLGLPKYYEWRSRSGCYFCFFQRKIEWVRLLERDPVLFEEAKRYEKFDPSTGTRYTWSQGESLAELSAPARVAEIKRKHEEQLRKSRGRRPGARLFEVFAESIDDEIPDEPCIECHC